MNKSGEDRGGASTRKAAENQTWGAGDVGRKPELKKKQCKKSGSGENERRKEIGDANQLLQKKGAST